MSPAVIDSWRRWRYKRLLDRMAGPRLLTAFAEAYPEAFFIEIGANDGAKYDHLRPLITSNAWRGVMVEPVPYVFARLQRNYGAQEGVALENAAIAQQDGRMTFFHLREATEEERPSLPPFYDALGSFSREAITGHVTDIPDIEERLVETSVPTLSFSSLCAKHGVQRLDLVLIDTEGYDWEIIRHADLRAHHPRLLVFEHYHLDAATREEARRHLRSHGYELLEEGFDTFCLDTGTDDELTRTFRGLKPAIPATTFAEDRAA